MESLSHSVTRLVCKNTDGNTSTGTAFFFGIHPEEDTYIPIIVTNKHVVSRSVSTTFYFSKKDDNGNAILGDHQKVEFKGNGKWVNHPNPNIDLCAATIGDIINEFEINNGTKIKWSTIMSSLIPSHDQLQKLSPVQDVLMVGYPIGLWDEFNNRPIFRKGITATHPAYAYNGKKEFLIDIAAFPGSSGSPIFLYREGLNVVNSGGKRIAGRDDLFYFVGVLYAGPMYNASGEIIVKTVPTELSSKVLAQIPSNLGIVIASETLGEFEKVIKKPDKKQNN